MEWIKIIETNEPDSDVKIAFLTNHILFPDNAYFGTRTDGGNYYSNGRMFSKEMITHYFYVESVSD